MRTFRIAAALGAALLCISFAQPAAAQVGDSKPDPRSRAKGVTDNPNTSTNPVGTPNSTAANRCAGMTGKERDNCMANLKSAKARDKGASTGASSAKGDRPAATRDARSAKGTKGVSDNPNTSQNPGTGGSQMNRGGDSKNK